MREILFDDDELLVVTRELLFEDDELLLVERLTALAERLTDEALLFTVARLFVEVLLFDVETLVRVLSFLITFTFSFVVLPLVGVTFVERLPEEVFALASVVRVASDSRNDELRPAELLLLLSEELLADEASGRVPDER